MRLAVLADIHGNLLALEAVIAGLKSRSPDLTVNLGDCVSGPLWPRETCDLLMSLNWPTIRGNCDRAAGQEDRQSLGKSDAFAHDRLDPHHRRWLTSLPQPCAITETIFACHGTPAADDEYLLDDIAVPHLVAAAPATATARLGRVTQPFTLCGHSHIPRLVQAKDGRLVLNPGSVGLPAYDSQSDGQTYYSESGSPHARYAMVTMRGSSFDVEMIAVTYNHEAAARKAQAENRAEYVRALRTGTMR
jgi:predicted phosphodiesterase